MSHLAHLLTDAAQLDDALDAAAAQDGPALVEIITDPDLI
jgi:thiamine pyrophosphate-dependent acetolactate synthase large subunit-like protein